MVKAATGIVDHGVKTRISVKKRAKALVFKKNRRSSLLEIAQKVKSRGQLQHENVMHAGSERASQTLLSPKRYRTKYLKDVSSHWESFPFICLRSDIV